MATKCDSCGQLSPERVMDEVEGKKRCPQCAGKGTMKTYRVRWDIDVDAESPREAAQKAREIQLDPNNHATVFDVADDYQGYGDDDEDWETIDLAEEDDEIPPLTDIMLSVKLEGEPAQRVSLEDFCRVNASSPDLCDRVCALAPGETTGVGGGAASPYLITREK